MLDEAVQKKLIDAGRRFTKGYQADDPYQEDFESDQQRRLPQPPQVLQPILPNCVLGCFRVR